MDVSHQHPLITCNRCQCVVDGIAYRTACFHLLCTTCAKESFSEGVTCSVCSTVLSKGDVKEVTVGVPNQSNVVDQLFQAVLCDLQSENLIDNLYKIRLATAEIEQFVCTQLYHEANQQLEARKAVLRDKTAFEHQLMDMEQITREKEETQQYKLSELEKILNQREKDLSELKDAYKEKHRKCQAWEKAYNNIRDQVVVSGSSSSGGAVGNDPTNPSSTVYAPSSQAAMGGGQSGQQQHYRSNYPGPNPGAGAGQGMGLATAAAHTMPGTIVSSTYPPPSLAGQGQGQGQQHPQDNQQASRSFRRTQVTTYSKVMVPQPQLASFAHTNQPIPPRATAPSHHQHQQPLPAAHNQHHQPPSHHSSTVSLASSHQGHPQHRSAYGPGLGPGPGASAGGPIHGTQQYTSHSYESPQGSNLGSSSGSLSSPLSRSQHGGQGQGQGLSLAADPWAAPRVGEPPVRETQRHLQHQQQYEHHSGGPNALVTYQAAKRARPMTFESPLLLPETGGEQENDDRYHHHPNTHQAHASHTMPAMGGMGMGGQNGGRPTSTHHYHTDGPSLMMMQPQQQQQHQQQQKQMRRSFFDS